VGISISYSKVWDSGEVLSDKQSGKRSAWILNKTKYAFLFGTVKFKIISVWVDVNTLVFFVRRTPTMIYVRESHVEKMGKIQDVSYEILNVLEFNR